MVIPSIFTKISNFFTLHFNFVFLFHLYPPVTRKWR